MPTNAQLFEYGLFATFAYLLPGHPTLSATFDYFEQRKKGTQTHSGFILAGPSYLNVWTFGFVVSILFLIHRLQCAYVEVETVVIWVRETKPFDLVASSTSLCSCLFMSQGHSFPPTSWKHWMPILMKAQPPQKKTNGWVQMKLDPLKRRCMDIGDDHGYHVQVPCQFSRV